MRGWGGDPYPVREGVGDSVRKEEQCWMASASRHRLENRLLSSRRLFGGIFPILLASSGCAVPGLGAYRPRPVPFSRERSMVPSARLALLPTSSLLSLPTTP